MSNRRPAEGKVQLTERGCEALAAWMKLRHIQKTDLADAMGTNQMAPTRMLKRQGFLTLEQAGRLVAFAGGELTAEQLVGADRSAAVPTYPLKVRVRREAEVVRPVASVDVGEAPGPDDDDDELADPNVAELERQRDDMDARDSDRQRAAMYLAKLALLKVDQEREHRRVEAVKEVDLIAKFRTLVFNRTEALEREVAASAPSATAMKPEST